MKQVRWGMVSAGNIAGQFASDIKGVGNAYVHTVAARNGEMAETFADKHDIPNACEGYDQLFKDPDIDAVYISTPHTLHVANAVTAIANGKAVMCEKPIATSEAELDTLLHAAASNPGTFVMEAMWTWFLPAIQQANKWLKEGRIGQLRHINASFGFARSFDPTSRLYNPDLAGGCLLDMGIYPIAIARYFFEQEPTHLDCVARFAPNGVEDDVSMQFTYSEGTAQLTTSMRATLPNVAYIIGSKGHIRIPAFWRATDCHLYLDQTLVESYTDRRKGGGFEFQIEQASHDILEGKSESAIVPHTASRAFQADMDWVKSTFKR